MGENKLGRLVDPDALASSSGPRGRVAVRVPAAWAEAGAELEVVVPRRVTCARCDGGGCDGCGKSGAIRVQGELDARTLRVRLPAGVTGGVALRIGRPFGDRSELDQILVEVIVAERASENVSRRGQSRGGAGVPTEVVVTAIVIVLGIVVILLTARG